MNSSNLRNHEISEDDKLLRRVQYLDPNFIKPDGTPASSSFSLKSGEDGLSVDVESLTTFEAAIQDVARFRLFILEASFTLSLGLVNKHVPKVNNPAHALIMGHISRGIARKLAQSAKRVVYPV